LAARLIDQAKDACENNDFTVLLDTTYFAWIIRNNEKKSILRGEVQSGGLNISFKDLTKVPKNLSTFLQSTDCIERLYFNQNYIEKFPEAIAHFPNAKKVDLSYNRIMSLDFEDENIQFDQVEELTLSGNPMDRINANITKFPNLVKLYLEDMPNLEDVSEEIKKLENLKIIVIRDSPIGSNRNKIIKLNKWLSKNEIRVYWKSRRNN
jgi:Leucine-rich repeat (LRR) protein